MISHGRSSVTTGAGSICPSLSLPSARRSSVAAHSSAPLSPPHTHRLSRRALPPRAPSLAVLRARPKHLCRSLSRSSSVRLPSPSCTPITPPWPLGRMCRGAPGLPEPRAAMSSGGASGAHAPQLTADSDPNAGIDWPELPLLYVAYVCFKCFRRFKCMLQLFHLVVAKVDQAIKGCCTCCICCKRFRGLLQAFVQNV
jgi:hypothetical protein